MRRICYFDNLTHRNSNHYWLAAFQKMGEVQTHDVYQIVRNRTWCSVPKKVKEFHPTHIHFGGSVKHGSIVSVGFVRWLREQFPGARVTYFFGDGYNKMAYYYLVEPYVDNVYMSNSEWTNGEKFQYMPCPAPAENVRPWTDQKRYDVVFIGNNYNPDRLKETLELKKKFNLTVFGNGWPPVLGSLGAVAFEKYSDICASAKIVMADPAGPMCKHSDGGTCFKGNPDNLYTTGLCRAYTCSAYAPIRGYLSNRLANTLIAGTVHMTPYVEGIEEMFTKDELVCYKTKSERDRMIKDLLANPERCKKISLAGQKKVLEHLTYEKCARRILGLADMLEVRRMTERDVNDFSRMRNAEDTYRWFFSGKKFSPGEVKRWLQNLPPTDEVYMVDHGGDVVGTCSIYNIDLEEKSAEVGRIIVDSSMRGRGLGSRILNEMIRICKVKGLKMIYAYIKEDNVRSQKAFQKVGFKQSKEPTFYWRAL